MNVIGETAISLIAAAGLIVIGWLLVGRLLSPVGKLGATVYAVVPAAGSGHGLEHTVHGLRWLCGGGFAHFTVIVVDEGLDDRGLAIAQALRHRQPEVVFCHPADLTQYIKEQTQDE